MPIRALRSTVRTLSRRMAEPIKLDWDHVYLLGWHDKDGHSYLTTWSGDRPWVEVVVTGAGPFGPPIWKSYVPNGVTLHEMSEPSGHRFRSKEDRARLLHGIYAFGWYIEEGIEREKVPHWQLPREPVADPVECD